MKANLNTQYSLPNTHYLNIVKQIVLKHVPKNEFAVFLFGSLAAGNANMELSEKYKIELIKNLNTVRSLPGK